MESPTKRLHLRKFIPASVCKELQFIHKSCNVAGYRPFVLSTTLLHLVATGCLPLIMPFLPIRETIKNLVEEFFGCEFELSVEFTGLISWMKGAKIGWHSDNGKAYLKQRHFTAVCYLNSHALDFDGGLFHFQEGFPTTVVPEIGDVLIYKADDVHCVDEIMQGERCTLALWFTKDSSFDEDGKLLDRIGLRSLNSSLQFHATTSDEQNESIWMPFPPSSSMYLVDIVDENEQNASKDNRTTQTDLRVFRVAAVGFDFCISIRSSFVGLQEIEGWCDESFETVQNALEKPIMLKSNNQVVPHTFANSIHALQVLYFCKWKESDCQQDSATKVGMMVEPASKHEGLFLHLREWEHYMTKNYNELQKCFPVWNHFKQISPIVC